MTSRLGFGVRLTVTLLISMNVILVVHRMMPDQVRVDFTITKPDLSLESISQFTQSLISDPQSSKISRIIHITWKDFKVPKMTVQWLKQWRKYANGWRYIFWTDSAARKLVKTKFPEHLQLFDAYPEPIYRADAMRYFILYEYGGVYGDLDIEPKRDFNLILDKYACVLSQEPDEHSKLLNDIFGDEEHRIACNAFMACRPKHPFFYSVIRNLEINHDISKRFHHDAGRTILSTGPGMLTRMMSLYHKNAQNHTSSHPEDDVQLAPASEFTPIFDEEKMEYIKFKCERHGHLLAKFKKKVCKDLQERNWTNVAPEGSYTSHHWFHSWLNGTEGKEGRSQGFTDLHLQEILPGIEIADYLPELSTPIS